MNNSMKTLVSAISLAIGTVGLSGPASAIVPDGTYDMVINDTPYSGGVDIFGSDGAWNSSFTFGCLPASKGCTSQAMYDNDISYSGRGSGIFGDGVSGILNITVSGNSYSVNSFNVDAIRFTAGGDFLQYLDSQLPVPPANPVGTSLMSGTINGTSMTLDPTGRLGSVNAPLLLDRLWLVDDCTIMANGTCDPTPNGNTSWEIFSTGTASNTKGTIAGTPLVNVGDLNGDGIDDFAATLVSGATVGSSWGGFFGAQYFEVWNVSLLSMDVGPPPPTISISIPGGTPQECTDAGNSTIPMNAQVTVSDGDAVDTISWALDGSPVASGESVDILVPLGNHTVEATINTVLGESATDSTAVAVEDTTAPAISAAFINKKTGAVITAIRSNDKANVSYSVSEACDPDPTVSATAGIPAENGDTVSAKASKKDSSVRVSIQGNTDNIELTVTAKDASGNMSSEKASLTIVP